MFDHSEILKQERNVEKITFFSKKIEIQHKTECCWNITDVSRKRDFLQKQWNPAVKLESKNKYTTLPLNKCGSGVRCVTFEELRVWSFRNIKTRAKRWENNIFLKDILNTA